MIQLPEDEVYSGDEKLIGSGDKVLEPIDDDKGNGDDKDDDYDDDITPGIGQGSRTPERPRTRDRSRRPKQHGRGRH